MKKTKAITNQLWQLPSRNPKYTFCIYWTEKETCKKIITHSLLLVPVLAQAFFLFCSLWETVHSLPLLKRSSSPHLLLPLSSIHLWWSQHLLPAHRAISLLVYGMDSCTPVICRSLTRHLNYSFTSFYSPNNLRSQEKILQKVNTDYCSNLSMSYLAAVRNSRLLQLTSYSRNWEQFLYSQWKGTDNT